MRLSSVQITGYRSFFDTVTLHLDPSVTIIIGANDHGKTNLLDAISHLNAEKVFEVERDLNWDYGDDSEDYPSVSFTFALNEDDRQELLRLAQERLTELTAATSATPSTAESPDPQGTTSDGQTPSESTLSLESMPVAITVLKKGASKSLITLRPLELPEGTAPKFMKNAKPRVEMIKAQ